MIIENISEKEQKMIYDMISLYVEKQCKVNINVLLRFYEHNKINLFHLLGDKLIYEVPSEKISLKMSKEIKARAVERAINAIEIDTIAIYNYCRSYGMFEDYKDFEEALVTNSMNGDDSFITDSKVEITYTKDSKAMKTIGKVIKEAHVEDLSVEFEKLRNSIANALNTPSGQLCLSIHPLDFITMSMNDNNWRSCMSWDNGEYRQGTVEMMNSPTVICAYIKSDSREYNTGVGEWNSKSWRQLFIVDENVIINSKGYPYQNISLSKEILTLLKDMAKEKFNWNYYNEIGEAEYTCDGLYFNTPSNEEGTKTPFYFHTGFMYNDLYAYGNERLNFAYFSASAFDHLPMSSFDIDYSGESECMICGTSSIESEDLLYCEDCDPSNVPMAECTKCGRELWEPEELYRNPMTDEIICLACERDMRHKAERDIINRARMLRDVSSKELGDMKSIISVISEVGNE